HESSVGDAAAAAFDRAERSRSGFLDAVHALDHAAADPAARDAVRAWLHAGVRWSAAFEECAQTIRHATPVAPGRATPSARNGAAPADDTEPAPAGSGSQSGSGTGTGTESGNGTGAESRAVAGNGTGAGTRAEAGNGSETGAWEETGSRAVNGTRAVAGTGARGVTRTGSGPPSESRYAPESRYASGAPRRGSVAEEDLRQVMSVEHALDAAEADVLRLAPAALTASRTAALPDAAAVADALPAGTLLLTYHLFDEHLVAWAMTHDRLRAERRAHWAHGLVATSRRFHTWCSGAGAGEDAGAALADLLLRMFADELAHHERVIVVPPARLSLLPFHALPWNGDVLGATHEVSYLPAASLLTRHRPPERPWREARALLVGAPATHPRRGLAALPGTGAEVAAIARMLPRPRLLTGDRATHDHVVRAAEGCEVLHLAAHGLVDDLAPHRARLALAGDDVLDMADLVAVAREPRLLVLSACNTGRGTATAGGDVLGLTRAALITGARHAIVSLWPVGDATGCLVITRTYRHLLEDPAASVTTALTRAQREVRTLNRAARDEEFRRLSALAGAPEEPAAVRDSAPLLRTARTDDRHPSHWAPFIHVGV
ncbi:CHAT domain-containing protein, partial [Streptomyces sp. 8N706]|uniref:CHAT domain-containing protein n=1 Tax=Streptomyces sp. 8N706 TaxID=3457416 RepID=UPI003FD28FD7